MDLKFKSALIWLGVSLFFTSGIFAQSASDLLEGEWLCDVEGFEEKVIFRFMDDEKADMGWTINGEVVQKKTAVGTWSFEDEDVNEDLRTVITFVVRWENIDDAEVEAKKQKIVATVFSEDKMEVRWVEEPMRIWNRIKKGDNDDNSSNKSR